MERKEYEKYINKYVLINSVKTRPVLWDKTLDVYKDKAAKASAWREICNLLMGDYKSLKQIERQEFGKLVLKKWTQTRDAWIKTLHDKKKAKKSGVNVRPYRYHNQMLFLKKVVDIGEDSITLEENTDEEIAEEVRNSQEKNNSVRHSQRCTVKRKLSGDDNNTSISYTDVVDRHLSFFKSLLPSLALLDDDQTLEFHSGVIHLLQNVKNRRGMHSVHDWSTPHAQSSNHSNQSQSYFGSSHPDSAKSPSPTHSQDSKLSEDPLYSHKFN